MKLFKHSETERIEQLHREADDLRQMFEGDRYDGPERRYLEIMTELLFSVDSSLYTIRTLLALFIGALLGVAVGALLKF